IQQLCMPGLFILHGEAARATAGFRDRIVSTMRQLSRTGGESMPRLATNTVDEDESTLLGGVALLLHRGFPAGGGPPARTRGGTGHHSAALSGAAGRANTGLAGRGAGRGGEWG